MHALVTGASGFIGSSIVRELLKSGHSVRALVRASSRLTALAGLPVEIQTGDILDPPSLLSALTGCDTVFHAAADYRLWTSNPASMYAVNIEGTRNVLAAALQQRTARVIYTSSVGTLGNFGDGRPGDEKTPVTLNDMVGNYKKSKFLAERVADEFIGRGLPLIIVNPTTPVGPGDLRPTPTGKMIVDFLQRKMPAYLETGLNIIDVDDCARGHILAAEKGTIGEKYLLGGENLMLKEILSLLAGITGEAAPQIRLPYTPVLLAAACSTFLSHFTGKEPMIPLTAVRMAKKIMFFSPAKAERDLGLPKRPAREALARSVAWYRENGYA